MRLGFALPGNNWAFVGDVDNGRARGMDGAALLRELCRQAATGVSGWTKVGDERRYRITARPEWEDNPDVEAIFQLTDADFEVAA